VRHFSLHQFVMRGALIAVADVRMGDDDGEQMCARISANATKVRERISVRVEGGSSSAWEIEDSGFTPRWSRSVSAAARPRVVPVGGSRRDA
jgi:hypothetical protein